MNKNEELKIEIEQLETFLKRLRNKWEMNLLKIDWLSYETFVLDVLKSQIRDSIKISLCKEALNAWTRRGHFNKDEYVNADDINRLDAEFTESV